MSVIILLFLAIFAVLQAAHMEGLGANEVVIGSEPSDEWEPDVLEIGEQALAIHFPFSIFISLLVSLKGAWMVTSLSFQALIFMKKLLSHIRFWMIPILKFIVPRGITSTLESYLR